MSDENKVVQLFGSREPAEAWVGIDDDPEGGYSIRISFSDSPPVSAGHEVNYRTAIDIARRKGALLGLPVLDFTMHAPSASVGGDAA